MTIALVVALKRQLVLVTLLEPKLGRPLDHPLRRPGRPGRLGRPTTSPPLLAGACALTVAAVLAGKAERTCTVTLPGGDLQIEWRESDNHIYMTGPAEPTFRGEYKVQ